MVVMAVVVGVLVGLWLGSVLTNHKWASNSGEPARVSYRGDFYKVVKISSKWSWDMINIHRNPIGEKTDADT